jgi:hypothetical protein
VALTAEVASSPSAMRSLALSVRAEVVTRICLT